MKDNQIETVNQYLKEMEQTAKFEIIDLSNYKLPLKTGVDLGTSNIVITVLDSENRPVAYELEAAHAVKDGIVVDYLAAVDILRRLKKRLEKRLGVVLSEAATAIPPGISAGNTKVISNVVAGADFNVCKVVDEPEAAARMMGIKDGIVVDIGGGTTGVSVIENGVVLYSLDEPTGGTHMTLVVAGALDVDFHQAEAYKKEADNYYKVFALVQPVIEKMASITRTFMKNYKGPIYLAGGTSCLRNIEEVFASFIRVETVKPENPLLVTPIGIAMSLTTEGEHDS